MSRSVLLIGGSLNQTTMLHQVAQQLPDCDCHFSPFYADGLLRWLSPTGLLDHSILAGAHRRATLTYLRDHHLPVDEGGQERHYDLVLTGTDLIVQRNIRHKRLILIQEGITEPEDFGYELVKRFNLPRYLANTAATGLSDAYDLFCVASPGYRDLFISKGVRPQKILVTGIPNFDNAASAADEDFPLRDFVLVATSSIRETGKLDDRAGFLRRAGIIAAGRPIVVRLHPNEDHTRAIREIRKHLPGALVYTSGNTNAMIARCAVLITQVSSVVYTGIALNKEVHSYFDVSQLRRLAPIQNGGTSAMRIAEACRTLLQIPLAQLRPASSNRLRPSWKTLIGISD